MTPSFKSGFAAIIGKPNVGKSTLLNNLLNKKVAIVSDKPETTRDNIRGILTTVDGQVIFVDTPGIHRPHLLLGRVMVTKAKSSLFETDLLIFIVELTSGLTDEDFIIVELIKDSKKPAICIINKIDIASKSKILPIIDELKNLYNFLEFIPVSALKGDNIGLLKDIIFKYLPQGEKYYPDSQITDKDERFQVQELIREKILALTRQEVPHSIAVFVDNLDYNEEKKIYNIDATVYVERDSQKGIIIGQKGDMIKAISTRSRIELEEKFGQKVFLRLWVKVLKNWRRDIRALKSLGIE